MQNYEGYPSYSIAIRTLGTAGEKYQKLLNSIHNLLYKPEKVVVVLPLGYALPRERLGYEQFEFSPKGMILQRIEALKYVDSKYILFCDDDVELEPDFSIKLIAALEQHGYSAASGPLLEFFPPRSWKYVLASLLGGACVMVFGRKKYYTKILNTGGWSYNSSITTTTHRLYDAESLAWTCFMVNTNHFSQIKFDNELWLEKSGYAAFEDRVMFYKLILNGFRSCVVSDAKYYHNDGKTSTKGMPNTTLYAGSFNHYVFWYRYLYQLSHGHREKIWKIICIHYYMFMSALYSLLLIIFKRRTSADKSAISRGFKDAKKFIRSIEFKEIPNVIVKNVI